MFQQEGYDLMGAAFEVYNQLGYGMAEEVYQESLEIELNLRGIPFVSKKELRTFYKNRLLKKALRTGSVRIRRDCRGIEGSERTDVRPRGAALQLHADRPARQPVDYLINFGHRGELEWKRFILGDLHEVRDTDVR